MLPLSGGFFNCFSHDTAGRRRRGGDGVMLLCQQITPWLIETGNPMSSGNRVTRRPQAPGPRHLTHAHHLADDYRHVGVPTLVE